MMQRTRRRKNADRRRRLVFRAALLLVAMFAWSGVAARTLEVAVQDGLATVNARNVPLGEVLQAVAREAGFRLVAKDAMPAPVNWSFRQVPVEQAVNRLLAQASFVSIYAPSDGYSNPVLAEVRVLRPPTSVAALVIHGADQHPNWDGQVAGLGASADRMAPEGIGDPADGQAAAGAAQDQDPGGHPAIAVRRDLPRALASDDPAIRRTAAAELAKQRPEAARGPLTGALSDPDSIVRIRAVQGLTRIGGEEVIASLSKVLLEDADPRVRRMAAAGLGRMNTESAFWALMEANSDEDPGVREAVTQSLANLERRGLNSAAR